MQYSASIDDFARIMKDGNNGGYANNWLIADRKSNEVASLDWGSRTSHCSVRKMDSSWVPIFQTIRKLIKEETTFDPKDRSKSENVRHDRRLGLMEQHKGKIDMAAAEKFLGDHFDTFAGKMDSKIERWDNLPVGVRQHLIDRMRDRSITIADLNKLRVWVVANSTPERAGGRMGSHSSLGLLFARGRHVPFQPHVDDEVAVVLQVV